MRVYQFRHLGIYRKFAIIKHNRFFLQVLLESVSA